MRRLNRSSSAAIIRGLLAALLGAVGCSTSEPTPPDASVIDAGTLPDRPDATPTDTGQAERDGGFVDAGTPDSGEPLPLVMSFGVETSTRSSLSAWALIETRTAVEVEVQIQVASSTAAVRTSRRSAPATLHRIPLVGMRALTEHRLTAVADPDGVAEQSEPTSFTTGALPSGLPIIRLEHADPARMAPGITFVGTGLMGGPNAPLYIGLDERAEVVWYWTPDRPVPRVAPELKQLPTGDLLIFMNGEVRIIDVMGQTLLRLRGDDVGVDDLHHDALLLPNGNFMLLGREIRTVNVPDLGGDINSLGDTIVEVTPSGETVWTWSTFDHLDAQRFPDQLSRSSARETYDWTHGNAILYDEVERAVYLCLRHQHWVVKIDRDTGQVLWRFGPGGDFALTSGEWFYGPHAPELRPGGQILLYDNGTQRPGEQEYSRAAQYELDPTLLTATEVWSYTTPLYTSFLGDVDTLDNGHVLIAAGGIGALLPDDPRAMLIEVSKDPIPVELWRVTLNSYAYRAERVANFR